MQLDTLVDRPDTETRPHRPFRILDAMILIAALFVALAWDRGHVLNPFRLIADVAVPSPGLLWGLTLRAAGIVALLLPFLVLGSLAVFVLRFQPPRPVAIDLLRQPGTIACTVASLAMIPVCLMVLASHLLSGRPFAIAWTRAVADLNPERLLVVASMIGLAVLVTWIVMAATGRWKPESGWIDRLGRLLGVGWIAMIFGGMLLLIVQVVWLAGL